MILSLKKAFAVDNLKRAWLWTRTNPDPRYKNYFRHIYSAYSLAVEQRLNDLNKRFMKGTYIPIHSTKIYLPKKSGILRPYTLLSIEDQILYQALSNVVAEKLYPKVRGKYLKNIFGHLYAGKNSTFFYKKWQKGYKAYVKALEDAYHSGFEYTASFDLTACYDSIDHGVLKYYIEDIGLEKEFGQYLCEKLRHWSATDHEKPIYQEHGIPQGPLPSGIISECVLRFFDQNMREKNAFKYFRYVDDIRLLAKSESVLREQLINLDMLSKNIGLFPQSSKIDIHKITNINDEIKNISNPPEYVVRPASPDQKKVFARIKELSPRYVVKNETRLKFVLGSAKDSAELQKRLLKILEKQPHLYSSVFNNLRKSTVLSKKVSEECVKLLRNYTLYGAFTAELIKTLNSRLHQSYKASLTKFCKKFYNTKNSQLKIAVTKVLIDTGTLKYKQKECLAKHKNWWVRSNVTSFFRQDFIGKPSYDNLINIMLRDKVCDVAIVASDCSIENISSLPMPRRDINKNAQYSLKQAGLIGRVLSTNCFIHDVVVEILGAKTIKIEWKKIAGRRYKEILPKFVRWHGYYQTDATAWVNITDTINDFLLDILFTHDGKIGNYQYGNIGGALNKGSKFEKQFPQLFWAAKDIHEKRLESDLSHAKVKATGKLTHFIKYKELKPLVKKLSNGYVELYTKW